MEYVYSACSIEDCMFSDAVMYTSQKICTDRKRSSLINVVTTFVICVNERHALSFALAGTAVFACNLLVATAT